MQDSFVLWQLCVCLFYCTFSSVHFVYLYLFYITCILLWYTLSMHTFFVHLVIADNFLSFVPSFYFLQHSCNSVRIFVSFSSLVYGIATVSDSAVACRVQLAVVRVCVCACVRVCVCVCVCVCMCMSVWVCIRNSLGLRIKKVLKIYIILLLLRVSKYIKKTNLFMCLCHRTLLQ